MKNSTESLLTEFLVTAEEVFSGSSKAAKRRARLVIDSYEEEIGADLSKLPEPARDYYISEYKRLFLLWLVSHEQTPDREERLSEMYGQWQKWRSNYLKQHAHGYIRLVFPDNERQFVELYLDKRKYGAAAKQCDLYGRAARGQLSEQQQSYHGFIGISSSGLAKQHAALKRQLFHTAVYGFAAEVAQRQVDICLRILKDAPAGLESQMVAKAPMPSFIGRYEGFMLPTDDE